MREKLVDMKDFLNEPAEEAYKVLRTNIQFYSVDKKLKTITITSCGPGEGKTTTATNLAISMAKASIRVLLVDADLRKPILNSSFPSQTEPGLTDYIAGRVRLDDIIHPTILEHMYFTDSGAIPPNPAELIASNRFKEFLEAVQKDFDLVIFDTPPLGSVIDSAVVASQTDGTILVISSKKVDYHEARRIKEQLERVNARILGVVLNKIPKGDYSAYCNYRKYYGKRKKSGLCQGANLKLTERAQA